MICRKENAMSAKDFVYESAVFDEGPLLDAASVGEARVPRR